MEIDVFRPQRINVKTVKLFAKVRDQQGLKQAIQARDNPYKELDQ